MDLFDRSSIFSWLLVVEEEEVLVQCKACSVGGRTHAETTKKRCCLMHWDCGWQSFISLLKQMTSHRRRHCHRSWCHVGDDVCSFESETPLLLLLLLLTLLPRGTMRSCHQSKARYGHKDDEVDGGRKKGFLKPQEEIPRTCWELDLQMDLPNTPPCPCVGCTTTSGKRSLQDFLAWKPSLATSKQKVSRECEGVASFSCFPSLFPD